MRAILAATLWVILCGAAALGCGGGDDDGTSTPATGSSSESVTSGMTTAATESTESADPGAAGADAQATLDDLAATSRSVSNCVNITNQDQPIDGACLLTVLDSAQSQVVSLVDHLQTLADGSDPACATAAEQAKAGAESLGADLGTLAEQAANDPSGITAAALSELATGQAGAATRVKDALAACVSS